MSRLGPLALVTDRTLLGGRRLEAMVDEVLAALPRGAAWVQLREKDLPAGELAALAARVLEVCRDRGAPLLINDRVDVALAVGADGVHLPERGLAVAAARALGPRLLVGRSVHSAAAAAQAARDGADLVVLGPVWPTPSKRGLGEPVGLGAITDAVARVREAGAARLYAIGGIEGAARAAEARAAGADGVAVIRAVWCVADPAAAACALLG